MSNSYPSEPKVQAYPQQTQLNYQQGQYQTNYPLNQPDFQQSQPPSYQNQPQPNSQQYQQNYPQQPNYQQTQYNYPSQNQPYPQQNQAYPQQYPQQGQSQPNTQQYQQNYPQQPNYQQNSYLYQQIQSIMPENQTNLEQAKPYPQQYPQQGQQNVQQNQTSPSQQSNYQQNQYPSQQNQPNMTQNQAIPQQSQPNVQQPQLNVSQQPNLYQTYTHSGQTQLIVQQNQSRIQQSQSNENKSEIKENQVQSIKNQVQSDEAQAQNNLHQSRTPSVPKESNNSQQPSPQVQPIVNNQPSNPDQNKSQNPQGQSNVQKYQLTPQEFQLHVSQQPNYQQSQSNMAQNQPVPQQNQISSQQSQPNSPQKPHQNQPNFGQIQSNIQKIQPNPFQAQANENKAQPNNIQQLNIQQNQPLPQQGQPNVQQNQSPINKGNVNVPLNGFVPQNLNQNAPPVQMGPKLNNFGIAINLVGENTYEEDSIKFQLFHIQGSSVRFGEFSTWKGYMEFKNVQQGLIAKYAGSSQFLSLPDEILFLMPDDGTLQERRDGLSKFLRVISCSTDFFYSAEFQKFLAADTASAKEQANYIKQKSQILLQSQLQSSNNNANMPLNGFVPPPNKDFSPVQMLPNIKANKFGIAIDITGETPYEEDGMKFSLFDIQGSSPQLGKFSTTKGYKDFVDVRVSLMNKYPAAYEHLDLPDEILFLKPEDHTLQERKDGLAKFLKTIACSLDLFYFADFQKFLLDVPASTKEQADFLKQQNEFQLHAANISINIVKEFMQSNSFISAYKVYVIQGKDLQGEFSVNRRYSDFVLMREILVERYPGASFVPLPSASSHGAGRWDGLVIFLQSIPKLPFVYQSEEWQLFIRYQESNIQARLKAFKLSKTALDVIVMKIQSHLPQQSQPNVQQDQQNQGDPNLPLNGLIPPQNPNQNFPPIEINPDFKLNKFGIAIDIIAENTWEVDSVKFQLYHIQGASLQLGEFSTWKGYMEFKDVQHDLINKFAGSSQYLKLPDEMLFLKVEDHTLQARRDGLATFLKMVACSTEFFYSDEFQKFLFADTGSAKQQAEFIKQQNIIIMANNPDFHAPDVSINIIKEFEESKYFVSAQKVYVIQGRDPQGDFTVNRSYSDFALIREILVERFPRVPFFRLPAESSFSAEKLNGLILFLQSIAKLPFVYQTQEWQIFIRHTEADVAGKLKPFKTSKNILEKYVLKFDGILNKKSS